MQEIEAKFYVRDLKQIETRIQTLGARLIQPRVFETNLRFDLPDGRLRSEGQVLRLRQDTEAHLTYKGDGVSIDGIVSRKEIEFTVEDFDKAKLFLEALGYQKILQYDKYRTTYDLASGGSLPNLNEQSLGVQACHIMLDELPIGNFVEIEGPDVASIQAASAALNLNHNAAITASYSALFARVKQTQGLAYNDLTFENFKGIHIQPEDLQVSFADV